MTECDLFMSIKNCPLGVQVRDPAKQDFFLKIFNNYLSMELEA